MSVDSLGLGGPVPVLYGPVMGTATPAGTDPPTTVTASDGVALSVTVRGPADAPVLLAVHGYPDDHRVWDGVAAVLADRYRVVTYDVRGAGRSGTPRDRSGFRLDQLADDLDAVIAAVSPDRPVHLLAHDWGSIQTWHAVTGHGPAARAASYTSVSGPSLDHAAFWLRGRTPGGGRPAGSARARLRQGLSSWYVGWFHVPVLPELVWRSRFGREVAARLAGPSSSDAPSPEVRDLVDGMELYRANMLPRARRPEVRRTGVPVQVLTPTGDVFVSTRLQDAAGFGTDDLVVRPVRGGHWVVRDRPEVVAEAVDEFIRSVTARAGAR
ncbi:alpha/beta fold hydrolase [Jatrophihabitans sp. YIM 134969]